jgi:putative hemolysin
METKSAGNAEQLAELYTTLILTPIVFVFGEIVPKNVFQRNADRLMPRLAGILRVTHWMFQVTGIVAAQRWFSNMALRRFHRQTTSGSAFHTSLDVYQVLREGAAEGVLSRMQSTMIERVHVLKTVRAGSIMVPFNNVEMLPADSTRASIEHRLGSLRHSRIPIYRGDRRNVVGVVHLLDILTAPPQADLASMARPPIPITSRMPVMDALALLQREYRRIAIVVEQDNRCVGIVTVKDLVEEIVGELAAW